MLVGTQVLPETVFQRGVAPLLDEFQELAGINTVLVFFHTLNLLMYKPLYLKGAASLCSGDQAVWVRTSDKAFARTSLRYPAPGAGPWEGRDVIDELLEEASSRGMQIYARALEPFMVNNLIPGLLEKSEINLDGLLSGYPCLRDEDYTAFTLATFEDVVVEHPGLGGIKYGQERASPIVIALSGGVPGCFCSRCNAALKEAGYDPSRATEGYRALRALVKRANVKAKRPSDGWFASLMRIFFRYPDMLAHHRLWYDAREEHRRLIYKQTKEIQPSIQVGWHIDHHWSWDLFGRAALDFSELAGHSDFLSLALYFDRAGVRMANHFRDVMQNVVLGDVGANLAMRVFRSWIGQDPMQEPGLVEMEGGAPLSPDHIRAEVERAVDRAAGRMEIYPRVGFDFPQPGLRVLPRQVRAAFHAALNAGADGILFPREYGEASADNLKAAGQAVRSWMGDQSSATELTQP